MSDIVFLFCAFIISFSCIVYFLSRKSLQKAQSYIFLWLMITLAVSAVADIVSNYIEHFAAASGGMFTLQYATQMIYFFAHVLLSPLYALYIIMVNGSGVRRKRRYYVLFFLPVVLLELMILTNPINGFMFSYNRNLEYQRGSLIVCGYVIAGIYLMVSIYNMVIYRKAIATSTNIALWYFFSFTIAGIYIQLYRPEWKVELFAESISMLGVMLTVENEDEFLDGASQVYNRRAFMLDNKKLIRTGHHYAVICLNMTNLRFYTRMLSYKAMSNTLRSVMRWLKGADPDVTVYRVSTNGIGLIQLYREEEQIEKLVSVLKERFEGGWVSGNIFMELNTIIRVARVPEELSEPDLLLELAEEVDEFEKPGVQVRRGSELYYITRRVQVEAALKRALLENHFEVYYQPIWNAETDRIETAEALIRLNDPELGFLQPEELIPSQSATG